MKAKVVLILLISFLILSPLAYSKECPDSKLPKIDIEETEELYEYTSYYNKIIDEPINILKYMEINFSMPSFGFDSESGILNFTPKSQDIGEHKLLFVAIDHSECYTSKLVTFKVYDRPKITSLKPASQYITLSGGQNLLFVVDVEDEDDDIIDFAWYINDERQSVGVKDKFPFITDYNMVGVYNISLSVVDEKGLNDSFDWKVNVKKSSRKPYLSSELPNYAAPSGGSITTDSMGSYFGDADGDILTYSVGATDVQGNKLDVEMLTSDGGEITIIAPQGFTGMMVVEITARDPSGNTVMSNKFSVRVFGSDTEFDYASIVLHVCGDGICGGNDTCSNCERDCGPCDGQERCINKYECTEWSECILPGFMMRECVDLNACYDQSRMPVTGQICKKVESCYDLIKNQGEKKVDCSGPCAPCPTCKDNIQNHGEEGIDCGGPCSTPCPSCIDSIQNQFESDIDCGGACDPCDDLMKCYYRRDCKSHVCREGVCLVPTCDDGVRNQDEEGVDCEGVCGGVCPVCDDGIKNQDEEGIDCGGSCDPCPSCDDGIKNQDEMFVDCGGDCERCTFGDFKVFYEGRLFAVKLIGLFLVVPFLLLLFYELWKKLFSKTSVEKLIFINRFFKNKKRFSDQKEVIEGALNKINAFMHGSVEAVSLDLKDEALKTILNVIEKVFNIDISSDEKFIMGALKEREIGYPLNRIILNLFRKTKKLRDDKYLSGLEIMSDLEKIGMIIEELKKET